MSKVSFFHDEKGGRSSARVLLWIWTLWNAAFITADWWFVTKIIVPEFWALDAAVFSGLLIWAAGPRMMEHGKDMFARMVEAIKGKPKE
jgi:hypothetical protein